MALTPVFFLFVITHAIVIIGGLAWHAPQARETAAAVATGFQHGTSTLGVGGLLLLLIHAFSMGGGTYTGIEAVSNGIPMMRHPQVQTAKRTMIYMAVSLAFTATGLLLCYLLWDIHPVEGKTMNATLVERMAGGLPLGGVFILLFLIAEGAILVVAAQAGFADGPRVLSNMALDSWAPRRFAALSERLTTQNGIMLMGGAALIALLYTRGDVRQIVVMYSINVFLTFSLSLLGMSLYTLKTRGRRENEPTRPWKRNAVIFISGFAMCATILVITSVEKFTEGGWITLLATSALVGLCMLTRRHYTAVAKKLHKAFEGLEKIPNRPGPALPEPDRAQPAAVILVGNYSGFGIHTTLNVFRAFPNHFKSLVFVSVGTIDSGGFKGEDSIDLLRAGTSRVLEQYAELARRLGIPSATRMSVGTDTVDEAEKVCLAVAKEFPRSTFFAGQVIFERETWMQRLLHNQTAYAIQRRLQWAGKNMVILAARA
jgi:amino acid transporter